MDINSRSYCKTHHVGRMKNLTKNSRKGSLPVYWKCDPFIEIVTMFSETVTWFSETVTWFSEIVTWFPENVTWFSKILIPENVTLFPKSFDKLILIGDRSTYSYMHINKYVALIVFYCFWFKAMLDHHCKNNKCITKASALNK